MIEALIRVVFEEVAKLLFWATGYVVLKSITLDRWQLVNISEYGMPFWMGLLSWFLVAGIIVFCTI